MNKELVFYTNPLSRGRTVRWLLEEIGVPYRVEVLAYGDAMKSPEYLAINPLGKVPTLVHGDTVITETAAICAYLADAFPTANLAPALDNPARGDYYRWFFFTAGPVEAAFINQILDVALEPEQQKVVGYGEIPTMLNMFEETLKESHFLVDNRFSAVDVYVGSFLAWMMMTGQIERSDVFDQYLRRLMSRKAAKRANELDDALL